jgi:hypothetical protein
MLLLYQGLVGASEHVFYLRYPPTAQEEFLDFGIGDRMP